MDWKTIFKKLGAVVVIIIFAGVSVYSSIHLSKPDFYTEEIHKLEEKQQTVMGIALSAAVVSTLCTMLPDDTASPLAEQIMQLSSYLTIVLVAIFLEKILMPLTGLISFKFLIPIGLGIFILYIFSNKEIFIKLSSKLIIFAVAIHFIVPVSVQITAIIDKMYPSDFQELVEVSKKLDMPETANTSKAPTDSNPMSAFVSKIKDTFVTVKDNVTIGIDTAKNFCSNLMNAVAVLIITSCVIPIFIIFLFSFVVKLIFGIDIPVHKIPIPKFSVHKKKTPLPIKDE